MTSCTLRIVDRFTILIVFSCSFLLDGCKLLNNIGKIWSMICLGIHINRCTCWEPGNISKHSNRSFTVNNRTRTIHTTYKTVIYSVLKCLHNAFSCLVEWKPCSYTNKRTKIFRTSRMSILSCHMTRDAFEFIVYKIFCQRMRISMVDDLFSKLYSFSKFTCRILFW